MNYGFARSLTLAAAALLLAGPALAQDRVPIEKSRSISGTITSIQKETRQFVLKGEDGKEYIFALDERTSIRDQDKDVRLLDMGTGVKVTVSYVPDAEKLYAVSVLGSGKKGDVPATPEKKTEAS